MPVYRITIKLFNGKGATFYRLIAEEDIDLVFACLHKVVRHKYPNKVDYFDCVPISRYHKDYLYVVYAAEEKNIKPISAGKLAAAIKTKTDR